MIGRERVSVYVSGLVAMYDMQGKQLQPKSAALLNSLFCIVGIQRSVLGRLGWGKKREEEKHAQKRARGDGEERDKILSCVV